MAALDHIHEGTTIHVVNPMPFDGTGPSQTSLNIAAGFVASGCDVNIYATRRKTATPTGCRFILPFANIGKVLPYSKVRKPLRVRAGRLIATRVPEGGLVYAWPATTADELQALKDRGCFVSREVINIHTQSEKALIEHEMDREGFRYAHYVTDEKIRNQNASLALSDVVFCANPNAVETVVANGVPRQRVVLTRYGPSCRLDVPVRRNGGKDGPLVFAFVGRINLEKGVHLLLRAWKEAGEPGILRLYGKVDPLFAKQYADLLSLSTVQTPGFLRDIAQAYSEADAFLFFSLAEGGPQVTLEAAAYELPMVVSEAGGGRVAKSGETALVVDPHDTQTAAGMIRKLADDAELRAALGKSARAEARHFSWRNAAIERLDAIAGKMSKEPNE